MSRLSIILSMGPDPGPASLAFRGKVPTQIKYVVSKPSPPPSEAITYKEDPAKTQGSKKVVPKKHEAKMQMSCDDDMMNTSANPAMANETGDMD